MRLGQFCENFENTRENLSLILLGLMRLHIQMQLFCIILGRVAHDWYPEGPYITKRTIVT